MRLSLAMTACVGVLGIACRNAQPRASETPAASERTVFSDSALHAEQCEPPRPGEDWRKACIPKDQSARPARKP